MVKKSTQAEDPSIPINTAYIASDSSNPDRKLMGGKAATLAKLSQKFIIPDWIVVTPQAFIDCLTEKQKQAIQSEKKLTKVTLKADIKKTISNAVKSFCDDKKQLYAIRSSATEEDGEQSSFAGQLDSFLNVSTKDIPPKLLAVWQSAFSEHATLYRKNFSHDLDWIPAVIIQKMVDADCAGVAFSANPVNGDRMTCVINATTGLADQLVSGEINGETYYTDRKGQLKEKTPKPPLTKKQIKQVIKLLLKVEAMFGMPQDIEWAFSGETLYLLQARPITNLPPATSQPPEDELTIWDNSNIIESYSGITSPLTFSFARYVYQHVYIEFCRVIGVQEKDIEQEANTFRNMLGYVNGHIYYNLLNWYRLLARLPGFKMNRAYMEQMMGVKQPLSDEIVDTITPSHPSTIEQMKDGFRILYMGTRLTFQQLTLKNTCKLFYTRLDEALSTSIKLDNLSLSELGKQYRLLESKLLSKWDAPLINDFLCMIAFGVSRRLLESSAGQQGLLLHNDIMIGQGDIISAEPASRIKSMADRIKNNQSLIDKLIAGDLNAISDDPVLADEFHSYLAKFGDRCLQELKLESPTLHDDPTLLVQTIGMMANRENNTETHAKPTDMDVELFKIFKGKRITSFVMKKIIKWTKERVADRENLRFERTRLFGRVRNIFIEIGKRLQQQNILDDVRDIFQLQVDEVMGIIEGTSTTNNIQALIALRKKQFDEFQKSDPPPNRFETKGPSITAFQNIEGTNFIKPTIDIHDTAKGIGCCQGIVKAPVKVINDPRTEQVKPGEIMVAQFTDPGWILLFANAAGILVERGSLLSHSAIVAREMGIPAIVAVDGIMQWLQTGDVVEMNGSTGEIKKYHD